jgi:hypothetical protein
MGYKWSDTVISWGDNNTPKPTLGYLYDDRFANQNEKKSLITATRMILRDLNSLYDYIEPGDDNLGVYSHRIYELFLRTATEFEANCKGILKANAYSKTENEWCVKDYFKISRAARLNEYSLTFERWETAHEFRPFVEWNPSRREPLAWYDAYNEVKHDRYGNFKKAKLEYLMNALAGLICIMHAQYGEGMSHLGFSEYGTTDINEGTVVTPMFTINAPRFPDEEQYGFIWDNIKSGQDPIVNYTFG